MSEPTLITAPTDTPIEEADLRMQLRISDRSEDQYLRTLIEAATETLQAIAWRQFMTATYSLTFDSFASRMELPKPPLQSVTIAYLDTAGNSQALATTVYEVVTNATPGFIRLKYGQTWPAVYGHPDAVTVTFVCGYGAASAVPARTRHAVKLLAAHLYQTREPVVIGAAGAEVPMGIRYLLDRANQVG